MPRYIKLLGLMVGMLNLAGVYLSSVVVHTPPIDITPDMTDELISIVSGGVFMGLAVGLLYSLFIGFVLIIVAQYVSRRRLKFIAGLEILGIASLVAGVLGFGLVYGGWLAGLYNYMISCLVMSVLFSLLLIKILNQSVTEDFLGVKDDESELY